MTTRHQQVHSRSPEETQTIARTFAAVLGPGDTILLDGPIGAGKSHFARSAILARLAQPEDVPSPTYTLVQTYLTPDAEIWHADLYRLNDPAECHELGLVAAFEEGICFVEWPDRLGADAPRDALTLAIEPQADENSRVLVFSWSDARWDPRMREVPGARTNVA